MDKQEREALKKQVLQRLNLGSREKAIAKAISDLSDDEKLEFFTFIYPMEDESLALTLSIADRYDLGWLKKLVKTQLRLRTSIGGWRAKQIAGIASEKQRAEGIRSFFSNVANRIRGKENPFLKGEVENFE